MATYKFSELTLDLLKKIVRLKDKPTASERWEQMQAEITEEEHEQIRFLTARIQNKHLVRMNEATIWARAIYPLLMLAEKPSVQVWAEAPMSAQYPNFSLEGVVDGVIAREMLGEIAAPYLIVVEAKKGIEAKDPVYQMLGEMLAAAWMNYQNNHAPQQEIYGCYTVSDTWTFAAGTVAEFEAEHPLFTVELSRQYEERIEAEAIVRILKSIVAKFTNNP
jgi:hypothetical protein